MPTKATLKPPSKNLPPRSGHTVPGQRLADGIREVAAHLHGEINLTEYGIAIPGEVEVADIRARLELSQAAFAKSFGLNLGVVQAWEQKRRRPDRCARILLAVIAKEPEAVRRALTP
jgi:putative transcriptional regulator